MADEEKDIQKPVDADTDSEKVEDQQVEEAVAEEPLKNQVAEKRGRMVAAGLIAAVILCVIAVVVAGVFQLTVRLMTVCPTDLPVNEPAKVLWKETVSEKSSSKTLGVSESLLAETRFKGLAPEAK